jgi:choline dehydrogenase-like flavoprotein
VGDIFVAAEQTGMGTNRDVNSGDPIGMGMGTVCIYKGQRLTASSAYLSSPLPNLTVVPNSSVARILFKGKTAVGVETISSRTFYARKEVIISGGALNTPQIMMLSGIGPREELEKHRISVVHDLPTVGKNLQDHASLPKRFKAFSDTPTVPTIEIATASLPINPCASRAN